jgi:hypothetical protein
MQSSAAQSVVNFLVSLAIKEPAAIAVATKNDDHPRLLMRLYSIVKGAAPEELCDLISTYLNLPQALAGEELEETMVIPEDYFLDTQASISSGKGNPAVQQFRRKMLEHAPEYCSNKETVALDDFVLQCSVTFYDLIDTKGTPAGVMGVFPEVLRDHISSAIPKAPALLERVLAEAEAARSARKRVRAPEGSEILEGPLRCDESIEDIGRACKVDSTDDKPVSAEEASAEDESAEDESAEEASGFTTPQPTEMTGRERKRLLCAPSKKQRV